MTNEELDYCIKEFSEGHAYIFKNGLKVSLFDLCREIKELRIENKRFKQKYEIQKDNNKLLCKAITCDDCNCSICEAHVRNVKLQKIIYKAIEYIKENEKEYGSLEDNEKIILEILRGDNNGSKM